jgi:hypothetical protein
MIHVRSCLAKVVLPPAGSPFTSNLGALEGDLEGLGGGNPKRSSVLRRLLLFVEKR